ncbi:MAG: hypothetical protein CTY31_00930 [Hyphomicrobium sp.]|nr:MAG: hypothetical protein CTY31_00930 [Hyphomicrobium sp.]
MNRTGSTALIFIAFAGLAAWFTASTKLRIAIGLLGILFSTFYEISDEAVFEWLTSAVQRPSPTGFIFLIIFVINAATSHDFKPNSEFRFAAYTFSAAGLILYPGAVGFLSFDPYVYGYSGYLLPSTIAVLLGYSIYKGYWISTAAINLGLCMYVLEMGPSLNFWDYMIDPIAWVFAIASCIAILIYWVVPNPFGRIRNIKISQKQLS